MSNELGYDCYMTELEVQNNLIIDGHVPIVGILGVLKTLAKINHVFCLGLIESPKVKKNSSSLKGNWSPAKQKVYEQFRGLLSECSSDAEVDILHQKVLDLMEKK